MASSGQSGGSYGAGSQSPSVPVTPFTPFNRHVNTYHRFITHFEPHEFESGWFDESLSGKTDVFIGDWSQLIKIRVRGEDAQAFFEWLATNHWPNFRLGQAKHAIFCNMKGEVMGEGLLLCVGINDFIFTSAPGTTWAIFQFYHGSKKFNATVENVTEQIGILQVQGPKSVSLLEEMVPAGAGIRDIKFNNVRNTSILGCDVRLFRNGISGELGFEIWARKEDCPKIYEGVLNHGKKFNIRELGGRAKMVHHAGLSSLLDIFVFLTMLQVEAAFATPTLDFIPACLGDSDEMRAYREFQHALGIDVDHVYGGVGGSYTRDNRKLQLSPYELGWGWLVNFDHDFIGKQALQELANNNPKKQVTLVWNKEDCIDVFASLFRETTFEQMELPRIGGGLVVASTVQRAGQAVGFTTSRCYSSYFKKMLSLGVVPAEHSEPGIEVSIIWGEEGRPQKTIRAVVQRAPYKEDRRKLSLKEK